MNLLRPLQLAPTVLAAVALTACASRASPAASAGPQAMRQWTASCKDWDDWDKPGPPFLIHGQTWYVGTCGISAILIVGPEGHTLIDSGSKAGADVIARNVEALGFRLKDVRTLAASHEHFDHVGGMAKLQRRAGAVLVSSPAAAPVLASGKASADDPQAGMHKPFPAAKVGHVLELRDGKAEILGPTELTAYATPGHTPGALTWQWRSCAAADDCKTIVYADSLTPISRDGYRFLDHPTYLAGFRAALDRVAALDCDILLTPHPSASEMRRRLIAGRLDEPGSCKSYAAAIRAKLEERLAKERMSGG